MSLDEDAVKLDSLCMQWTKGLVESIKRHLRLRNGLTPHFSVKCYFAHSKESCNIVRVFAVLAESPFHMARLYCLLDAFFCQILICFLWDYSIWKALEAERSYFGRAYEATVCWLGRTKWLLTIEQMLVNQKLINMLLIDFGTCGNINDFTTYNGAATW